MDSGKLQIEIQNESKEIINILGMIQSELDSLNSFTKKDGQFDSTVTKGIESMETLAANSGVNLKNVIHQNMDVN